MKPVMKIDEYGTKKWKLNGKHHREDGPAIEWEDGAKEWWINGKLHREDGPAIEYENGTKQWYINGKRHREDGPAIECHDGKKHWYIDGRYIIDIEKIIKDYQDGYGPWSASDLLKLKLKYL